MHLHRRGRVALIRSLDEVLLVSFPAFIGGMLASIGWRDTYRVMAIAVLVVRCNVVPRCLSWLRIGRYIITIYWKNR